VNSSEPNNPYQVPSAEVTTVAKSDTEFAPEPHRVDAGHGVTWVSDAWELFKKAPGPLILITFVYGLLSLVLSAIPLIGFLSPLITTVLMGGYYVVLAKVDREGDAKVEDLFSTFSTHLTPLILLGMIMLASSLIGFFLMMGTGMGAVLSGGDIGGAGSIAVLMVVLVGLSLILLAYFAVFYATILVVIGNFEVGDALKQSFNAGVYNVLPFLVYSLVSIPIMIIASIPLFLGWLVASPVLFAANYMSFKDIFSTE